MADDDLPEILKKPISYDDLAPSGAGPAAFDEAQIYVEFQKRFDALFEYFGIEKDDPEKFFILSFLMARKHYRGFHLQTEGHQVGRKRDVWTFQALMSLLDDMEGLREDLSERAKARHLAGRGKYANQDFEMIRRKYREAKAERRKILAAALMAHKGNGAQTDGE
ncbi:hypothetical protein [Caenispirillum salinarum]|uniref:hypothetical protein n=1 Tax=Caenispirillum salinarum TaxID=859058 RepID=UPI00384CDADE